MDVFDDIAAIAAGEETLSLEDAVRAYDQEGLRRLLRLWRRSVAFRGMKKVLIVRRYAQHLPEPFAQAEINNPFSTPPRIPWIKGYISWRSRMAKPRVPGAQHVGA